MLATYAFPEYERIVSLHGTTPALFLSPGDWVRHGSYALGGLGVLVSVADGRVTVVWSRPPRDETLQERMAREILEEIDAEVMRSLDEAVRSTIGST